MPAKMNPFEVKTKPADRYYMDWQKLYPRPYDKNEVDPYTRLRIILMNGTEYEANWFSHQFHRHCTNNDLRRELAVLRRTEQQQQKRIACLKPIDESILETTIGYEQLAVDLTAILAQREPDAYVVQVMNLALLEDFDHLYRYADLLELERGIHAERLVGCYTEIMPGRPTIAEHRHKPLNKIKVVFPGDVRNNMCYAWMIGAAKMGMHFVAMGPEKLAKEMDQDLIKRTFATARENGGLIEITDHMEDVKDADVIYGDIWASMGEEALIPERAKLLSPFRVTEETLKATGNPNVLYMHCLPSFHDFETKLAKEWQDKGVDIREVTDEVFRSKHSVVFDEAENRMHTIKAVMVATIGK